MIEAVFEWRVFASEEILASVAGARRGRRGVVAIGVAGAARYAPGAGDVLYPSCHLTTRREKVVQRLVVVCTQQTTHLTEVYACNNTIHIMIGVTHRLLLCKAASLQDNLYRRNTILRLIIEVYSISVTGTTSSSYKIERDIFDMW